MDGRTEMKKFMAVYLGTEAALAEWKKMDEQTKKEREKAAMAAWMKWGETNAKSIVDNGGPLGKTKRIDNSGASDIKNAMTGYTIVQADSHDAAAKLFANHPHFTMFPGAGVEVMEILPISGM